MARVQAPSRGGRESSPNAGAGLSKRDAATAASPAGRLAEIQRSRLLLGAVGAIDEFGYGDATVAEITSRARVSRRTFYELFDGREECLIALIDHVVARAEQELRAAGVADLPWRERIRGGLAVILAFFDREPVLARVCVVEALRGGPQVLAHRERLVARLAAAVDQGREGNADRQHCTALTAEALVGAAVGVIHARLLRSAAQPLSDLLGDLMAVIVLPYLGPAAARREQALASAAVNSVAPRRPLRRRTEGDPLREVPMRITYRTTVVLGCIAERPSISNREVAERAEVSDQGQISKLLARLERLGLVANTGAGHTRGERNAWSLTPLGRQVVRRLTLNCDPARAA